MQRTTDWWFTSEQSLADKFLPVRLVLDTTPLDPPPSPYPGRRFQPWAAEYELQGWRAMERKPVHLPSVAAGLLGASDILYSGLSVVTLQTCY